MPHPCEAGHPNDSTPSARSVGGNVAHVATAVDPIEVVALLRVGTATALGGFLATPTLAPRRRPSAWARFRRLSPSH